VAHLDAMKRATIFMDQNVSTQGAYMWAYEKLTDTAPITKWWGEMEGYSTMCWIQATSTPEVGNAYLDAYHATGNETFYKAAERTARALITAQHPAGGWGYTYDFAGDASLQKWFSTVGLNGWRLEEFQHYYGNATFDDSATQFAAQFMLRMYMEKKDPDFKKSVDAVIQFILDAQIKGGIADGGFPQRYPRAYNATRTMEKANWPLLVNSGDPNWAQLAPGYPNGGYSDPGIGPGGPQFGKGYTGIFSGMEDGDYTNFVTFNDAAMEQNILFLFLCLTALGHRQDIKDATVRAMDAMMRLRYDFDPGRGDIPTDPRVLAGHIPPVKQTGWSMQHLSTDTVDAYGVLRKAGAPAGARTYEARGLCPSASVSNVGDMCQFFRLTGDKKYLFGMDEVLDWVDGAAMSRNGYPGGYTGTNSHCRVQEIETNRPRFTHRFGSNIHNGGYYFDYDWRNTPGHYSVMQNVSTTNARSELNRLKALTNAQIDKMAAASPLNIREPRELPRYWNSRPGYTHLYAGAVKGITKRTAEQNAELLTSLGTKNYWSGNISNLTNPYTANGPTTLELSTVYMTRHVGDASDTSPYGVTQMPSVPPYNDGNHVAVAGISSGTFVSNLNNLSLFMADEIANVNAPDYIA
jgi:hypothetical protein